MNKAVADGALSYYMDHLVTTRVSKFAYGSKCNVTYDASDPEHVRRQADAFTSANNERRIPGYFDAILPKNTPVDESREFSNPFSRCFMSEKSMQCVRSSVWCYKGRLAHPEWMDTDAENYSKLCVVEMDLSHLSIVPEARKDGHSGNYWLVTFALVLTLSATELKASLSWMEGGVEKRSPAKIVFEPNDV